jgi:RecJ-like exonuclease
MSAAQPTPRVNAPLLAQHPGETVMLVGRVSQLRQTAPGPTAAAATTAVVDAAGLVAVHLAPGQAGAVVRQGAVVQFIGRVAPDLGVRAFAATDVGEAGAWWWRREGVLMG